MARAPRLGERAGRSRRAAPARRARPTGVASAPVRFRDRAVRARRRPWRIAAWLLGVAALGSTAVWAVFFSTLLTAQQVEVRGVTGAEATAVLQSAAVPVGAPLALIDTGAVRRRVASRLPIAAATVERHWPHTIVIQAVPRTPALAVRNSQGRLQVVDASGVAYATVSAVPRGVPLATAQSDQALTADALRAALSAMDALPADLRAGASDVVVSSADLVEFRLGKTTVVWGGADDAALKARIVAALLPKRPHQIDVSAPDTPVTR